MKNVNYLVVTELFLPTKGGTAVWFDEVYRRLGKADTHIVTKALGQTEEFDDVHPNTIHRLKLEDSKYCRPEALPRYLKLLFCTLWLALTNRFTAIHAGRVLPEGLVALIAARLTFHRCVIYAHGEEITTWSRSPRRLRAMKFAYRNADKVIANSDFTCKQLLSLGVSAGRIEVIYPGVDTERFTPNQNCDDLRALLTDNSASKIILSVGRLTRRKGFDNVIKALAILRGGYQGDFEYALIGIGEDEQYLKQIADESSLTQKVHLLGHVAIEDLPRWYNACDVFIMPNREIDGDTEGFGMVFIEAGACGKPVIAGRAGGTGDSVIDGQTGYHVDGENVSEIADKLATILHDEDLASAMGANGEARAKEELSWAQVANKTLELKH